MKLLILILFFNTSWYTKTDQLMPQFAIVVPSYNNAEWYQKNLNSIFSQTYPHYRVIYIDDRSPDNTGTFVKEYLKEHNLNDKTNLIINTNRKGALANLYYGIHSCQDHEIVVTLDGDDWFAHEKVLETLAQAYHDPNVWLTYGQYTHPWGGIGCAREINKDVIARNAYRETPSVASHLRTFYAWLFKCIKLEDLLFEGTLFPMTWDWAMMYPMLEMSGGKFRFISEVLYIYNTDNPINDSKVDGTFQEYLGKLIQQKKTYTPLQKAFNFSAHINKPASSCLIIHDNKQCTIFDQILSKIPEKFTNIYVIYEKSPTDIETKHELARSFSNITFIPYKENVNNALREVLALEQNLSQADFCILTSCDTVLTLCKNINQTTLLLNQTQAHLCSVIELKDKKVDNNTNDKKTHNNITNEYFTPLYDNAYTFQLGWDPNVPIKTTLGHVFSFANLEKPAEKLPDLITQCCLLHDDFKQEFPEYTGLLLINKGS